MKKARQAPDDACDRHRRPGVLPGKRRPTRNPSARKSRATSAISTRWPTIRPTPHGTASFRSVQVAIAAPRGIGQALRCARAPGITHSAPPPEQAAIRQDSIKRYPSVKAPVQHCCAAALRTKSPDVAATHRPAISIQAQFRQKTVAVRDRSAEVLATVCPISARVARIPKFARPCSPPLSPVIRGV